MLKPKDGFFTFLSVLMFLIALDCSKPTDNAGTGTETDNVKGRLVRTDNSPAAGVTVYFYSVDNNPRAGLPKALAAVDSTVTDSAGNYSDSLPDGIYNMVAGDDTTGAYQDSVEVAGDTAVFEDDTLKPFGSLAGVVRLQPGDDSRTVFLMVMGTNVWTLPSNAIGDFSLTDMAEGQYSVRILTTLDDYKVMDTTLGITAGTDSTLPDTIFLEYTGIPVPQGLTITYDTLKQLVTLTWKTPAVGRTVQGYNVFRKHSDSTSFEKIAGVITDTVYVDSTAVQDQTYQYKIAAVDTNDAEGTRSGADSVMVAGYFAVDTIYAGSGTPTGQFDYPTDLAISKGGDIYVVERTGKRITVLNNELGFKSDFGSGVLDSPWKIAIDSAGNIYVIDSFTRVVVFDSTGTVKDTILTSSDLFDIDVQGENVVVIKGDSILVLSLDGNRKRAWGGTGSEIGKYYSPRNAVMDTTGRIFVSDESNSRIQICDTSGNNFSVLQPITNPSSAAFDDRTGKLYANWKSSSGNTLRVYDDQGAAIVDYKYGNYNNSNEPIEIAVDSSGSILILLGTSEKIVRLTPLMAQ